MIKYQVTSANVSREITTRDMHFRSDIPVLELVSKIERVGAPMDMVVLKIESKGVELFNSKH
jgi:hypothetical protein